MNNSIADEILKAIKYAIDKQVTNCDRTFVSVVKKVNTDGTYIINDEAGQERKVKCAIPNISLSVGQNVYVKIPMNNLKRIHICGVL